MTAKDIDIWKSVGMICRSPLGNENEDDIPNHINVMAKENAIWGFLWYALPFTFRQQERKQFVSIRNFSE
ncbi:MAG: hypothetical protein WAO52_13830 [Prolixibacteraceae bacterium]